MAARLTTHQDYRSNYGTYPRQADGVIFDLMHEIDQACWLFGKFDRVKAHACRFSSLQIETENTACILLLRHNAPAVYISLDCVLRHALRRYALVGEEATLVGDLGMPSLDSNRAHTIERIDSRPDSFDLGATYVNAIQAFLEAIEDCSPNAQDIAAGPHTTRVALLALEAARS